MESKDSGTGSNEFVQSGRHLNDCPKIQVMVTDEESIKGPLKPVVLKVKINVNVFGFNADEVKSINDYYYILREYGLETLKRMAIYHDEGHNLVVNAGADQIANLVLGLSSAAITHCAVGTSSTAVSAGQTALVAETGSRVAINSKYIVSTGAAHADSFYGSSDAPGTWRETALFSADTNGVMFCRKVISAFTKSSSNTAVIAWTITFVPV